MQLFFQDNISEEDFELGQEESKHLTRVLRKSAGSTVFFTNGKGELFTCQIIKISAKSTLLKVLEKKTIPKDSYHIHLAIAPTKNQDRMEWLLEKITEIGCHEITFLSTQNTEKGFLKWDRLEKKIISACKQSIKAWKPILNGLTEYEDFISSPQLPSCQKFIAYVDEENQTPLIDQAKKENSYVIMIGPEGDFSPKEIDQALRYNFKACSLGKSRLRTETAGMVAVHSLSLINP